MVFSETHRSPYEIQLSASSANVSGIAVTLSTTTITQVNSLYISYVAYQESSLRIASGNYAYDPKNGEGFIHAPKVLIPRNYARIFGITGFIINFANQNIYFDTEWTSFEFHFKFDLGEQFAQYLSFEYLFFVGSECQDCAGYPYSYNGTCVNICPPNYFLSIDNVCLTCGEGRFWDGKTCNISCPKGQFFNTLTNKC